MKRLSVIVLVAAIMMSEALVFMIVSQPTRANPTWWDTSWQYRRPITIGSRPENYQVKVVIPSDIPKSDYPSIRFLWGENGYLLPYWIEKNENQYNTTGQDIAWVRVLDNSNDSSSYSSYLSANTIYMYYHNPSVVSADNGDNVFLEFTDFGGGANTDNWGVVTPAGGSVTWLNGSVKTTSTIGGNKTRLEWGEGQGVPVSEENENRIIEVRLRAEVAQRGGLVLSGTGWGDVEEACIFDSQRFWFDGLFNSSEQDNKWYIARADLYGVNGDNTLTIFYYGADNAVYRTQAVTLGPKTKDWSSTLGGGDHVDKYNLISWDASTTSYFDWFFVRKYAATEPSVDVGDVQALPTKPVLSSPANGSTTNNPKPTFQWTIGDNANNHRLLVDNDPNFSSPEVNVLLGATADNYTPIASLAPENYSWKVVASNDFGQVESLVWTFIENAPAGASVNLVIGWNLVNFTAVSASDTPNSIFAPLVFNTNYIMYFWNAPGGPYGLVNPAVVLKDNTGYWVDMITTAKVVSTTGTRPASENIHLVIGWNLVGFPIVDGTTTPNKIFAPLVFNTNYIMYFWNAPGGPYGLVNPAVALKDNTGYWVDMITAAKTVTIP